MRELANYTLELREVVQELFLSIASKPTTPAPEIGARSEIFAGSAIMT